MKKSLLISASVLISNIFFAQENVWMDSILDEVLLGRIEVFDSNFKPIKNDKIYLAKTDTVINCQWTRPKFIDNIFYPSFDGTLVEHSIVFDTATNEIDATFIDFRFPIFDENGNYVQDSIMFLISRKQSGVKKHLKEAGLSKKLKNTKWKNSKIELEGLEVDLDSCHNIFSLHLNEDFTFYQSYGEGGSDCFTNKMKAKKEVGVEGASTDFYELHDEIQGHYLNSQKGVWQVEGRRLKLIDLDRKKISTYTIEILNNKELLLKFYSQSYTVEMKKSLH